MLIYFEDMLLICLLNILFSIFTMVNLLHIKVKIFNIFLSSILGSIVLIFLPILSNNNYSILLVCFIFLLPIIFAKNNNIKMLLSNIFIFMLVITFYFILLFAFNSFIKNINKQNNTLLVLLFSSCSYLLINIFIEKLNYFSSSASTIRQIKINERVENAIIDTGNKVKYKGKEVVVVNENFTDKLISSNKNIKVKTINSEQNYQLYYIKELMVKGKKEHFYYNVPAIVVRNSKIILPVSYN